ncbi:MAG: cell division protein FtsQ [Pseudonocardiales bacterium]|nr:cell division protein FtsQ [Pseudonocardiales bacterium]
MTLTTDRPPPVTRTGALSRRWLMLAGAVVLVASLTWIAGFSSLLGVGSVDVRGTRTLSAEQITQAAAIKPGTPLIRLDTSAVQRRVEALPEVRSATVTTSYPSTVGITIIERIAVGYRSAGGVVTLLDAGGVAFRTVSTAPRGLPELSAADVALGNAAAAVAGSLSSAVAGQVRTVTAGSSESITLTLRDGRTVLWGGTDRNADKAKLLPAILGQPGRYFDVSDPDTVISR